MGRRLSFTGGNDGVLEFQQAPYAVIECATEADFLFLQEALEHYKKYKEQDFTERVELTLEDLRQMVGKSVYLWVSWGSLSNYEGYALVVKHSSEGFVLEFGGNYHSFLSSWYGDKWKAYIKNFSQDSLCVK